MKIISLGAGVQSSTMALMADLEIEKPDYAIFADTGWEPKQVYEWLDYIESKLSYPVIRVSNGNIRDDLMRSSDEKSFSPIPFFSSSGGMGRRQCTNQYKLNPIQKKLRELLGARKWERLKEGTIEMQIGISTDEAHRAKQSRVKWIRNTYPLIDRLMSRNDCLAWMRLHGHPQPPKSACIGCPYHSNSHWLEMKKNDPVSFADAALVDNKIRENGEFMHRSLKPIENVQFDKDPHAVDMFGEECEGICGT